MNNNNIEKENISFQPKKVFLFSGHMIDNKSRKDIRFPEYKSKIAGEKILKVLSELSANEQDLALTQGACGADILFTEACQLLGVKVIWLQPFDEITFLEKSVKPCASTWQKRYARCREKLYKNIHSLPQDNETTNPYEYCNRWLLSTALAYGNNKVSFITLWDGKDADRPGGTGHMYKEVQDKVANIIWIHTDEL